MIQYESNSNKIPSYLAAIQAVARATYQSIYIINFEDRAFDYVSPNPLFLCGHSASEVQAMGFDFYYKTIPQEDLDLIAEIWKVGFAYYQDLPTEVRIYYTISYDFHITSREGKPILIKQNLTPLVLSSCGKIAKAICLVAMSNEQTAGNIRVFRQGSNTIDVYNLDRNVWESEKKISLTDRELEILNYAKRGYNVSEIGEAIHLSPDTVKFHRSKLYEKLDVGNITEAIAYVTSNKLM